MQSKEFPNDIRNPKYRFAYEVMKEVMVIRGDNRLLRVKLPPPPKVLYTKEHAAVIENHLVVKRKAYELEALIKSKQCDYTAGIVRELMDELIDRFIAGVYSDSIHSAHSFVCTCAEIAYVGAYFRNKPPAQNAAINYIRDLVRGVPEDSNIFTNCNFTPSE